MRILLLGPERKAVSYSLCRPVMLLATQKAMTNCLFAEWCLATPEEELRGSLGPCCGSWRGVLSSWNILLVSDTLSSLLKLDSHYLPLLICGKILPSSLQKRLRMCIKEVLNQKMEWLRIQTIQIKFKKWVQTAFLTLFSIEEGGQWGGRKWYGMEMFSCKEFGFLNHIFG